MPNRWLERRVLCFAHQGGAKEAPSSTMFAIERAIALGADAIELDVHRSVDGVLVVCHDPTLDRTTNGHGRVSDVTFGALQELDAAFAFVPGAGARPGLAADAYPYRGRAPGERTFSVPSLEEVLEVTEGVFVNLDIKDGAPAVPAYEEDLARLLRRSGRDDDVVVTSFDDRRTAAFSAFAPEFATAPGVNLLTQVVQAVRSGDVLPSEVQRHQALQVPGVIGGAALVDERLVEMTHEAGLALHVWTIDDESEMERLVELGVDGVMTDRPAVLVQVLHERGARYRS